MFSGRESGTAQLSNPDGLNSVKENMYCNSLQKFIFSIC